MDSPHPPAALLLARGCSQIDNDNWPVSPCGLSSSPETVTPNSRIPLQDRQWVDIAGLVLVRQRLVSAKGVMFITLEDETGIANLVVRQKVFDAHRRTRFPSGRRQLRRYSITRFE